MRANKKSRLSILWSMISTGTFPEIARWWRRRESAGSASRSPRRDGGHDRRPRSSNPRTLLLSVTRSEDGLAFIRKRVKQLRDDDDPQSRFLLALYLEKLGEDRFEEALRIMDNALVQMPRDSGWAKSERARLAKAVDALQVRRRALSLSAARSPRALEEASPAECGSAINREEDAIRNGRKRRRQEGGPEGKGAVEGRPPQLLKTPPPPPPGPPSTRLKAVDERISSDLSYEEFIETYALRGRPVVLKGGASQCFQDGKAWDREALRREAGAKVVPVRRWVPDSVSWARLEAAGQLPLEQLLAPPPLPDGRAPSPLGGDGGMCPDRTGGEASPSGPGQPKEADPLYLHDWSLPQNLGTDSSLLGRFQVPKFFAGDMLQRLAGRGLPYTDSWPSLFLGPKGSKSDTHIDSFGSHFWMALLEGKKRWLLFPKEDAPLLYPVWPEGCHDPVFEAELDMPNELHAPAAVLARGESCVLEAGDLLFVPSGCPHHVENLTDTLALSCNYVDSTNVDASLEALRDQAFTDAGAGALASALNSCSRELVRQQAEVPWTKLKSWPREGEDADWLPPGTSGTPPTKCS